MLFRLRIVDDEEADIRINNDRLNFGKSARVKGRDGECRGPTFRRIGIPVRIQAPEPVLGCQEIPLLEHELVVPIQRDPAEVWAQAMSAGKTDSGDLQQLGEPPCLVLKEINRGSHLVALAGTAKSLSQGKANSRSAADWSGTFAACRLG